MERLKDFLFILTCFIDQLYESEVVSKQDLVFPITRSWENNKIKIDAMYKGNVIKLEAGGSPNNVRFFEELILREANRHLTLDERIDQRVREIKRRVRSRKI